MLCRLLALCVLSAALVTAAESQPYTLFHRITSLSSPTTSWVPRGSIEIAYDGPFPVTAELHPTEKLSEFVQSNPSSKQSFYQLALVPGSPAGESLPSSVTGIRGQVVTVKACLLDALIPGSFSFDVIGLTLSSNTSTSPLQSFNYDVVGFTKGLDGCPKLPIQRKGGSAAHKEIVTKLTLTATEEIEQPSLRAPPPPRLDGTTGAQPPPKEKSFLEKYWYYILPILVLLALPSDGGGGGESPSTSAGARRIR